MYTASGQLMQRCGDFPHRPSEPVDSGDNQVVAFTEPAHALGPTRTVTTGAPGSGVGEHAVGTDARGCDDIVLLIDRLLPGRHTEIDGKTHRLTQQLCPTI